MSIRFNRKSLLALAIASAAVGAMNNLSHAATITWTGGGTDANWLTAGNWSGTTTPPTNDLLTDTAYFDLTNYTTQPTVSAARSISGIVIDGDTSAGTALNISSGGNFTLSIGAGGIAMAPTAVGNATVSAQLQIGSNSTTISNASASSTLLLDFANSAVGGFNDNSYDPKFVNVQVTGGGAVAGVSTVWANDASGLTTLLGGWGTWGAGANTQFLTVTATANGTDGNGKTYYNLGGYTGGVVIGDVNNMIALSGANSNYEIPNSVANPLTNATIADGTTAKAYTIRYSGGGDTLTLGTGSVLEVGTIMNAGTGTLTIAGDSSSAVDVSTSVAHNTTNQIGFIAANGDIDVIAPLDDKLATHGSLITIATDGVHNVMFNAIQNTNASALAMSFEEGFDIGSTKNLNVTATDGAITLSTIGDYAPNGGPAQASSVTLNAGAGIISLANGSTYSGGTVINGGYVAIGGTTTNGEFGAAGTTVAVNAGSTIENGSTSGGDLATSYNYVANGDFTLGRAGSPGLTITGPWTLNNTVTVTTASAITLGAIGETVGQNYGMTVTGVGALTLSGTNSFTGALNVGDGVNAGSVSLAGASLGWADNIVLNPGGTLSLAANSLGTSTLTIKGGAVTGNAAVGGTPTYVLAANFTIGTDIANNNVNLGSGTMILAPATGNAITITLNDLAGYTNTLGSISDGGNGYGLTLTKLTVGAFTLGGTDTFTGPLTLLNGVGVTLGTTTALNRNIAIVMDPGTALSVNNEANTAAGLQDGPDVTATSGGGGVGQYTSTRALTLAGTGNYSFSGVLGTSGPAVLQLVWAGTGTQTLSGSSVYTNTTTVAAGTLNLNFGGFNAPAAGTNILYNGVAPSTMNLSGGTLQLSGSSTMANSQSFGILAVNAGGSTVSLAPNATTPQDLAVSTGNITRVAGGTVNFVLSGNNAAQTSTNGVLTTAANTTAGIIGGYATVDGSDWAVSGAPAAITGISAPATATAAAYTFTLPSGSVTNGEAVSMNTIPTGASGITAGQLYYVYNVSGSSFQLVASLGSNSPLTNTGSVATTLSTNATLNTQGNITALPAGSYAAFVDTATTNTNNYLLTGSGTATNSQTTNSLKITPSDSGQSLVITSGKILTLTSDGLLFTGNQDYTISGGTLAAGETIVQQFAANNNLTISSVLSGNLTKSGPGTLTLTGLNTYSGTTTLNGGVTNINSFAADGTTASALGKGGASAAINFNGGTLQYATGYSGNADITGRVVTINGAGATIDTNGNTIAFANASNNFGGGGLGGFTKAGLGTLTLNGTSTYQGGTTISGGTLSISTLANGGAASALGTSLYAAENLVLDSGTLQYTGATTSTDRLFTVTQNGGGLDASGSGTLTFSNPAALAFVGSGTPTFTLTGANTGNNTLNPIISDGAGGVTSVTKSGSGTWVLTGNNTYSGITTITGGTLKLAPIAGNNNIAGSSKIIVGDSPADNSAMLDVSGMAGGLLLASGQTLAGHGTVVGNVTTSSGSVLAPGNTIGTTSYSANLTLATGTVLDYEFAGSSSSDDSDVAGLLTLPTGTGSITLNMTDAGGLTAGTFKIFGYGTLAGGAPSSLNDTFVIDPPGSPSLAGDTYSVVNNAGSSEIDLVITGTPVPEPASLALLGLGAAGLLLRRRRRA